MAEGVAVAEGLAVAGGVASTIVMARHGELGFECLAIQVNHIMIFQGGLAMP